MNGFSGNWSPENNGVDFPGLGAGFTDMDLIRDGLKRTSIMDKNFINYSLNKISP